MDVRQIPAQATYDLRARVLRPGQPLEASHYPGDALGVHFGAFEGGRILSTVTAHPEQHALFTPAGQWRIRGMATEPGFEGRGIGSLVLAALLDFGRQKGIPLFWCNAREPAIAFYERHGFRGESELFTLPLIGPHKVLRIDL